MNLNSNVNPHVGHFELLDVVDAVHFEFRLRYEVVLGDRLVQL